MVYIPFFNIEVPEPRIADVLPDVFQVLLKICSRVVDRTLDVVFPLSKEEHEAVVAEALDAVPREFNRVIQRELEGKIKNDEMLSSELEDASFDYYRRQLRRGALGYSDECEEDFAARQLGLSQPSASEQVISQHAARHPYLYDMQSGLNHLADAIELPEGKESALVGSIESGFQSVAATRARLQEQAEATKSMKQRVRTGGQHAARVAANMGMGVGLGLLVFRGLVLGTQHLLKVVKQKRKEAKVGGRPAGPVQRAARTPAPAAPAAGSAKGTPAKGAAAASAAPAKEGAQQAPVRRARPTTRTR